MAPNLESDYYHWQWINDTLMVACPMNQLVLLDLKDATASIKYFILHVTPSQANTI